MQQTVRRSPTAARGRIRRGALSAATACAAAALLAACGGSSGSGGSDGAATLTLYSAQHPETTSALVAAFTKQTGIKVRVKSDDEDVLTAQIEQEGSHSPADLFFTENSNWLAQLDEKGLLAKVSKSTLAEVPARDSAANGDWLGVSGRYSVLIYNPSKISPSQVPHTVLALADPKYKGKLELAPAETDFWPIVTLGRSRRRAGRRAHLAERTEGERRLRRPHARQRDARRRRQRGPRRDGTDQPLLLLPDPSGDGRRELSCEARLARAS